MSREESDNSLFFFLLVLVVLLITAIFIQEMQLRVIDDKLKVIDRQLNSK